MVIIDKKMNPSLIEPFQSEKMGNTSYDLTTEAFCSAPGESSVSVELAPGDSVLVKSKETISLPDHVMAMVLLRNSRIRQGLDLSAPLYQPGHRTKLFFRVTNISRQRIRLDCSKGIASVMFIDLGQGVEKPYDGAFQSEFDYRGMGNYTSALSGEMTDLEKKVDRIQNLEKTLYGNVLSIMAVFVGIFTLLNINVTMVAQMVSLKTLLTMNFTTVGSVGFLIALVNTVLPGGKRHWAVWAACAVAFVAAVAVQFILPV